MSAGGETPSGQTTCEVTAQRRLRGSRGNRSNWGGVCSASCRDPGCPPGNSRGGRTGVHSVGCRWGSGHCDTCPVWGRGRGGRLSPSARWVTTHAAEPRGYREAGPAGSIGVGAEGRPAAGRTRGALLVTAGGLGLSAEGVPQQPAEHPSPAALGHRPKLPLHGSQAHWRQSCLARPPWWGPTRPGMESALCHESRPCPTPRWTPRGLSAPRVVG